MIKALCFDLDLTLVNSGMIILKSFDYAFSKCLKEKRKEKLEDYLEYIGPPLKDSFMKNTNDPKKVDEMIETYINYYKDIELDILTIFPTVKETLVYLKNEGYKLGLITTKFLKSATPSLKKYGLYELFDSFITLEKQTKPKPHKEPLLMAAKEMGVEAKEVIMVGDNVVDMMCGKNAGSLTALVSWNKWSEETRKLTHPDYYLEKMSDLINILKEINK